jgi:hypothetical protein
MGAVKRLLALLLVASVCVAWGGRPRHIVRPLRRIDTGVFPSLAILRGAQVGVMVQSNVFDTSVVGTNTYLFVEGSSGSATLTWSNTFLVLSNWPALPYDFLLINAKGVCIIPSLVGGGYCRLLQGPISNAFAQYAKFSYPAPLTAFEMGYIGCSPHASFNGNQYDVIQCQSVSNLWQVLPMHQNCTNPATNQLNDEVVGFNNFVTHVGNIMVASNQPVLSLATYSASNSLFLVAYSPTPGTNWNTIGNFNRSLDTNLVQATNNCLPTDLSKAFLPYANLHSSVESNTQGVMYGYWAEFGSTNMDYSPTGGGKSYAP